LGAPEKTEPEPFRIIGLVEFLAMLRFEQRCFLAEEDISALTFQASHARFEKKPGMIGISCRHRIKSSPPVYFP
jgi:hypothetical protein